MLHRAAVVLSAVTALAAAPAPAHAPAAERKTVAVLTFDNQSGQTDYDPLGRGLASMMISDLSAVPEVQLVERDRIQDLVDEIDRQGTKYFDSTTAVGVGRMTGAEYVVVGAITAVRPQMRIDTRVVRVASGEIVKAAEVRGKEDQLFDLQQKLAHRLIDGLDVALSPEAQQALEARQQANRIDDMTTLLNFSAALALYDRGDYVGASQKMGAVLQASPNSALVRLTAEQAKDRAARSATQKATESVKDKVNKGLGGLLKRRPPV